MEDAPQTKRVSFEQIQRDHWSRSAPAHDAWRSLPLIRELEWSLLAPLAPAWVKAQRLLDVGCGEADMLPLLRALGFSGRYFGTDFSAEKIAYAQDARADPAARFLVADATSLPFASRSFPVVLCRDLLHHVARRRALLDEILRVADERVLLIEPNPRGPLIAGLALVNRAERGILQSEPRKLAALARTYGDEWNIRHSWAEPQSATRLVLHHQYGLPSLGERRVVRAALGLLDRACRGLVPPSFWNYQIVTFERRG